MKIPNAIINIGLAVTAWMIFIGLYKFIFAPILEWFLP